MKLFSRNFNYLLAAIGIVFVWRGIWGLADLYLAPNNPIFSFISSIVIGIGILLLRDKNNRNLSELE